MILVLCLGVALVMAMVSFVIVLAAVRFSDERVDESHDYEMQPQVMTIRSPQHTTSEVHATSSD
jgi:hypothetical protein